MKPNQVRIVSATVSGDLHQVIFALESRLASQVFGDVGHGNRRNRIHDDVTFVHWVATTHFDLQALPDANAASDSSASDSLAKAFREDHCLYRVIGIATCLDRIESCDGFVNPIFRRRTSSEIRYGCLSR